MKFTPLGFKKKEKKNQFMRDKNNDMEGNDNNQQQHLLHCKINSNLQKKSKKATLVKNLYLHVSGRFFIFMQVVREGLQGE